MLAAVSVRDDTWSSARRDRSVLPWSMSAAEAVIESVLCLMRDTRSVSVSSMVPSAPSSRPKSPSRSELNSWLRSPDATVSAIRMAWLSGATMLARRLSVATRASTNTTTLQPITQLRALCNCASAAWAGGVAPCSACSAPPMPDSAITISSSTTSARPPNASNRRVPIFKLFHMASMSPGLLYVVVGGAAAQRCAPKGKNLHKLARAAGKRLMLATNTPPGDPSAYVQPTIRSCRRTPEHPPGHPGNAGDSGASETIPAWTPPISSKPF